MTTLPVDDTDEDDEQGEGFTEEGAGSTVEGSTRDEALTNSTKGSTEVVVECSTEVVVEGCSTEVVVKGSTEVVVEGSTKVVEGSIEELGDSIDSTDDDGTGPTVWLTDDEDAEETYTPRKAIGYQLKPKTAQYGGKQPCELCSNTFYSDAALQSHIKDKHSSK
ncbi:hypothetical protein Pyn_20219 [Prunus yedoensis var. nudiflora]|uniref:C2H2-type domain-containing protein n=1 Tax=Prunus yedoensis var. nudiflora TaxID=2094558 RepID=A0A314UME6_PRUYE|nr:hypothetical protein Pyn_20219 [Prunus yedoensis var. nudiflora]